MFKIITEFLDSLTQEQIDVLNGYIQRNGLNQGDEFVQDLWLRQLKEFQSRAIADDNQFRSKQIFDTIIASIAIDPSSASKISAAVDAVATKPSVSPPLPTEPPVTPATL